MRKIATLLTALGVFLCLSAIPTLAQQGGGNEQGGNPGMGQPGGPGQGGGMGPGGMGPGGDMGRGGPMRPGGMGPNTRQEPPRNDNTISSSSPTKLLSSNSKVKSTLQDRLGTLLPAGMSLTDAASGFKNLGEFVAAVHVSHNLDIPFSQLKDKMTGGENLGKAIHALKPDADAKAEAKKGKKEAKDDLKKLNS